MEAFNIVLGGVGGQGILLAAEILGTASVTEGLNVRVSEIHGMAQRGGAVVSMVRIGEKVTAATVMDGQADVLLGFEPLETLRNIKTASAKTIVIMSDERIPPAELAAKKMAYPSMKDIVRKIHLFTRKVIVVDSRKLAAKAGDILTQNVVMLGALAGTGNLPLKKEDLIEAICELIPTKHLKVNTSAFELGYEFVQTETRLKRS